MPRWLLGSSMCYMERKKEEPPLKEQARAVDFLTGSTLTTQSFSCESQSPHPFHSFIHAFIHSFTSGMTGLWHYAESQPTPADQNKRSAVEPQTLSVGRGEEGTKDGILEGHSPSTWGNKCDVIPQWPTTAEGSLAQNASSLSPRDAQEPSCVSSMVSLQPALLRC